MDIDEGGANLGSELSGLELILRRAAVDAEFRQALLAEPHDAIATAFGMTLPATFKLKFIERDPDVDVMVVLPDFIETSRPPSRLPRRTIVGVLGLLLAGGSAYGQTGALPLDEAVRLALAHNVDLQLARASVQASAGGLRTAQAPFDTQVKVALLNDQDRAIPALPGDALGASSLATQTVGSSLQLSRYFRSGVAISGDLSLVRTAAASLPGPPVNRSMLGLSAAVPLLKGRNGGLLTGTEQAAQRSYESSQLTQQFVAGKTLSAVGLAYWEYLAAQRQLEVSRQSEARAERLVDETRILVERDERAASDLNLLRANLATKRATRIDGEQRVVQARYALGTVMGVSPEVTATLPDAATEFPGRERVTLPPSAAATTAGALAARPDLGAARTRQEGARRLWIGAQRDLLQQVDLVVGVGYTGVMRGADVGRFLSPLFRNLGGLNTSMQIQYQPRVDNSQARGLALQFEAAYEQSALATDDLARTIQLNAAAALDALRRAHAAIDHTTEAVTLARLAVDVEQTKFRLGMSTLFDTLQAEDTMTNARLAEIGAQLRLASAIVRLRLETGALATAATAVAPAVAALTSFSPER